MASAATTAAATAAKKIGIIGSGVVGQTLAKGLQTHGWTTLLGTRKPDAEKITKFLADAPGVTAGTFEDAAKFGDIVVLATGGAHNESALKLAGIDNFKDKVVIDASNPLDFSSGKPELSVGHKDSGGQQVQRWIPDAKVVKCFNSIGNALMIDPHDFDGVKPDMWIAGDDAGAKATVTDLLGTIGWSKDNVLDAGDIRKSALLEALCILWVDYGMGTGTFDHGFKLLRGAAPKKD